MSASSPIIRPIAFVDLNARNENAGNGADILRIGFDRKGTLPDMAAEDYELLLTARGDAPAPWAALPPDEMDRALAHLRKEVTANPVAANMLLRQLRRAEAMNFADALECESLAYSALLGGGEFARWLSERKGGGAAESNFPEEMLRAEREGDNVTLILNDPAHRNAMSAPMRDALYNMLINMLDDPTEPKVTIMGAGKCFSTGGHLPEFGRAKDLSAAHLIRMERGGAALLDKLGTRGHVIFHGACVGSGLEVFAAAHGRTARKGAWFQLPELSMGLIPGAGGTVTVTRAIGRHRAAYMMLSGKRISAETAMIWGLVDRIIA